MGGTYTATIITRWVRLLTGLPAVTETAGFTPLVAAKDLTGWEGDKDLWSVRRRHARSATRRASSTTSSWRRPAPLATSSSSLNFRMIDGKGNSGVQFRSIRVPNREMSGYQADIGEGFWGCLYDESRRNKILVPASENAMKALQQDRLEPLRRSSDGRPHHPESGRSVSRSTTTRQIRASPGPGCLPCRSTPAGRWKCSSRM